jgi:hypothetical protein
VNWKAAQNAQAFPLEIDDRMHEGAGYGHFDPLTCTLFWLSLIHSAKLNGHDPYVYLKDVFTRLPTQPASRIEEHYRTVRTAQREWYISESACVVGL